MVCEHIEFIRDEEIIERQLEYERRRLSQHPDCPLSGQKEHGVNLAPRRIVADGHTGMKNQSLLSSQGAEIDDELLTIVEFGIVISSFLMRPDVRHLKPHGDHIADDIANLDPVPYPEGPSIGQGHSRHQIRKR